MEKRLRWQWRRPRSRSWRIDETYVRVRGQWAYLYRALDKFGNTLDFYLSSTRNTKAAKRFLGKALNGLKDWELPEVLNTDKAPTYAGAIAELKAEGKCPNETRHRQVKYLNNVVEADHGKLKLLRPTPRSRASRSCGRCARVRLGLSPSRAASSARRGEDRRACLRRRTVRSDRGHGAAAGPSGQRRIMRRPPVLLDHHTSSSGLQQSPLPGPSAGHGLQQLPGWLPRRRMPRERRAASGVAFGPCVESSEGLCPIILPLAKVPFGAFCITE